MSFPRQWNWLNSLLGERAPRKSRTGKQQRARIQLLAELLEDRLTPAAITISPSIMGDWAFDVRDSTGALGNNSTGGGGFATGPAAPPLGTGSAHLFTGDGADGGDGAAELRNSAYSGVFLSDLTALSYSTYATQWNGAQLPYLALEIDYTGDNVPDDRIFFEPVYQTPTSGNPSLPDQGAIALNTWQSWNALTGGWWSNNSIAGANPGYNGVKSLADYIAAEPNAKIVNTVSGLGGVQLRVGFASDTDQFNGFVDNMTIATSGGGSNTFDFENIPPPAVYVNASWAGTNPGLDPDGAGPATAFGADAFATIQDGVNGVASGGTVCVAAGAYTEDVTVATNSVTIAGPNAGLAAGTGAAARSAEAVLTGGFRLTADSITLDGLTILNGVGPAGIGDVTAVWMPAGSTDNVIQNNILTGNNTGRGILSAYNGGNDNLTIQDNDIGHWTTGIFNQGNTGVLVQRNRIHDNTAGIGNDAADSITINNNDIFANDEGIGVGPTTTNLVANFNNITGNTTSGLHNYGSNPVNAENNWWGTPSGPRDDDNPAGGGDTILEAVDNTVDYKPFLGNVGLPFQDEFTQADNSQLSRAWLGQFGYFNIQGNQATGTQVLNDAVLSGVSEANVTVSAAVTLPTSGGVFHGDLLARYSGPGDSNTYMAALVSSNGTITAEIWRNLNGTWTRLTQAAVNPALVSVSGGLVTGNLRFNVVGSSLKLFVGGTLVTYTFDSSLTTGSVGIRSNQGVQLDSFKADRLTLSNATLPFNDTFDGSNGSQLSGFWTEQVGNFSTQNNQLLATSTLNDAVLNGVSETNVTVSAAVTLLTSGGVFHGDLLARYSGPGDSNTYLGTLASSNGVITAEIWRNLNGTWTRLTQVPVSSSLLDTSISGQVTGNLRFNAVGSSLKLFVGGTLVTSTFDSSLTTGSVGIRSNQGVQLDNFKADRLTLSNATLPFNDAFDGSNGSQLSGFWTEQVGSFSTQNNQLLATSTLNDAVLNGVSETNVTVSAAVTLPTSGGVFHGDLLARYSGPGDSNTYLGTLASSNGVITAEIWRNLNGTWTRLTQVPVSSSLLDTSISGQVTGNLRFDAVGNLLRLSVGGTAVTSATDNSLKTGTVGIRSNQGVLFNNFTADRLNTALPFNDDFNSGTMLNPTNWAQQAGYLSIQGGQVRSSTEPLSIATVNTAPLLNTTVSLDVTLPTANWQFAGLLARYSGPGDSNAYLGTLLGHDGAFTAQIYRNLNGVWTLLSQAAVPSGMLSVSGGQASGNLRFNVFGNSLQLFVNGNLITSAYDSTITTAGFVGIRAGGGFRGDNFHADAL